jgi:hypothetical protein
MGLSTLYKRLKLDSDTKTNSYYHSMIEKYLLNKDNLGSVTKPILWIYLQNNTPILPEVNSRFWINFGSRLTSNFNQPYQKLTIQSIIDKCGKDFNVCLIDNSAFKYLLPNWNVNLDKVALPIRNHLQLIALTALLNAYGGIVVPSSFICFKSLKDIYNKALESGKLIVGQFQNLTCNEKLNRDVIASPLLMASTPNNSTIQNFNNYLSELNSKDLTNEQDFLGKVNLWLETNDTLSICGRTIGTLKKDGSLIHVQELLGSTYFELADFAYGLYIPWDQLINRVSLGWFVRLSPEQVLESNTMIAKYLLACH